MNSLIQNSYRRQEALTIHKIALAPESQRKSSLQVEDCLWCKFFATFQSSVLIRILRAAPLGVRRHHGSRRPGGRCCRGRRSRRVHVCLLLGFDNVLLVSDPLVAEPVADLGHGDAALPGQLLLGLLAGVGVGQVRVEILVEDLGGFFGKVATLAALI